MPEPYGSPEFREGLKFPDTKVGFMMQQLHEGLGRHGSFGDAVMENQFKRMGEGKPGEKPLDPMPFSIDGDNYFYSPTPHMREGFVVDEAMFVARGEDSVLLQVSHDNSDPAQIKDEAVLKAAGQTYEGDAALGRIPSVFPEFVSPVPVEA